MCVGVWACERESVCACGRLCMCVYAFKRECVRVRVCAACVRVSVCACMRVCACA